MRVHATPASPSTAHAGENRIRDKYFLSLLVSSHILISRQISYGQMIACENPDCATEWFHFACVGLKTEVGLNILFIG